MIMLAQQYMTGEQAVRIVGSEAQPIWLNFDRDYIQGEFDFVVEGGSTQPVNESFRRQMAMQVVDAMAPFAGAGILDMPKLATYILQYGFGIRGAASFVTPVPMMPAPPPQPEGPPMPPEGMPPQGPPMEMQQGPPVDLGPMPPTGGMAMPSNIPPEILAQLIAQGAPLPNTQGAM
jgi:hypothetical protein